MLYRGPATWKTAGAFVVAALASTVAAIALGGSLAAQAAAAAVFVGVLVVMLKATKET